MGERFSPTRRKLLSRSCWAFGVVVIVQLLFIQNAESQVTGIIRGRVVSDSDEVPLSGASVSIVGTAVLATTDATGRFELVGAPVGSTPLLARRVGMSPERVDVLVTAATPAVVEFRLREEAILVSEVVAIATGEARRLRETAATVGVISGATIRDERPTHPSAIMNQIPGVWVSVTGGEGHMTAIRQPQTTKPVYLFLEDGVPSRSTGFFNHNALYEVNLPQADGIEVMKGPASALYGSDAIGGVINVETRRPSPAPSAEAYMERGGFGYGRMLLTGSNSWGANGVRADVNLTRTDGWRDATDYDRFSGSFRWDSRLSGRTSIRTVLTGSRIDQQSAGASVLSRPEYDDTPRLNRTPISLRNVRAVRFSASAEWVGDRSLVTVTPFVRWNEMELLPNWSLTYDPTIYNTGHRSVGVVARGRRQVPLIAGDLIFGMDVDYSPGGRTENRIAAARTGTIFSSYELGDLLYDYDVTFRGFSPYLQLNSSPAATLHLTAGLRYDDMSYDYRNKLTPLTTGRWRRPGDAVRSYQHLSPKLGASFEPVPELNIYGNFSHGFRAPSEGQLFRQGSAANTLDLVPVTADSYEIGVRGDLGSAFGYSVTAYSMSVHNDILAYTLADGTPETQNAGETLHRGLELGVHLVPVTGIRGDLSYTVAEHSYESWSPRPSVDFAGNEMESAPRSILNGRLTLQPAPVPGGRFTFEWNRIGSYWLDPDNTHRYGGYDLLNTQVDVPVGRSLAVTGRISNLLDTRFAETAAYTTARGEELSPGMPRTLYIGARYRWERGP